MCVHVEEKAARAHRVYCFGILWFLFLSYVCSINYDSSIWNEKSLLGNIIHSTLTLDTFKHIHTMVERVVVLTSFCLCLVVNKFWILRFMCVATNAMHWHYDQNWLHHTIETWLLHTIERKKRYDGERESERAPPEIYNVPIRSIEIYHSVESSTKKAIPLSFTLSKCSLRFSADIRKTLKNSPYHDYVRCSRILIKNSVSLYLAGRKATKKKTK